MGYVFISYKSEDKPAADKARAILQEENIACWMAPYDIPAGSKYAEEINNAIRQCSCVLLLLTDLAQQSDHVYSEIEIAFNIKKRIIPMRLDDCDLAPGFEYYIRSNQIVTMPDLDRRAEGWDKILDTARRCVNDDNEPKDFQDFGDFITFGSYPQSKKADNVQIQEKADATREYYRGSDKALYVKVNEEYFKIEPIKWKVLERKENEQREKEFFVAADKILDAHRFHAQNCDYADSEIRGFLNSEFFARAFTDSQKAEIVTVNLSGSEDKVFLLDQKEAEEAFGDAAARQKEGTDYAKANNLKWESEQSECSIWWIRHDQEDVKNSVNRMGSFYPLRDIDSPSTGVLPALRIKIKEETVKKQRKRKVEDFFPEGNYRELGGGYVTFGLYPQSRKKQDVRIIGDMMDKKGEWEYYLGSDNALYVKYGQAWNEAYHVFEDVYYKVEPIKWQILEVPNWEDLSDGEHLIVSDQILDMHVFELRRRSSNNYERSEIRRFLNKDFCLKAFSERQREKIVEGEVDNSSKSAKLKASKFACNNTKDKVFLLSRKEEKECLMDVFSTSKKSE